MNFISFARSLAKRVAAVAVVLGAADPSRAADAPVPTAPAALVLPLSAAPCTSCAAPAGTPCGPTCTGKSCPTIIPGRYKPAFQTKLCPGACFGYFQTQWSKWEEVCPLPYQGQGFSDAPAQRTTPVTPVRPPSVDPKKAADSKKDADAKGSELPPPRQGSGTKPMPLGYNPLPLIPTAPSALPVPPGRFGS